MADGQYCAGNSVRHHGDCRLSACTTRQSCGWGICLVHSAADADWRVTSDGQFVATLVDDVISVQRFRLAADFVDSRGCQPGYSFGL